MPRLRKTNAPEAFKVLHAQTFARGERGDCSVKAVAIMAGVSYDEAHAALKAAGRQDRGGAYDWQISRAMLALGFKVQTWQAPDVTGYTERDGKYIPSWVESVVRRYPGAHKNLKHLTTHHPRRFAKAWASMPDLMMFTADHVLAFKDGVVQDWTINSSRQITQMWTVTPVAK